MRTLLLCVALLQASLYHQALSLSAGAPAAACSTLSPDPARHGAEPQTSTVPYSIDLARFCRDGTYSYTPEQIYLGCKLLNFQYLATSDYNIKGIGKILKLLLDACKF